MVCARRARQSAASHAPEKAPDLKVFIACLQHLIDLLGRVHLLDAGTPSLLRLSGRTEEGKGPAAAHRPCKSREVALGKSVVSICMIRKTNRRFGPRGSPVAVYDRGHHDVLADDPGDVVHVCVDLVPDVRLRLPADPEGLTSRAAVLQLELILADVASCSPLW